MLVLRQNDQAATAVDAVIKDAGSTGARVFAAGGARGTLPWIGDGHPACDLIAMLVPAYPRDRAGGARARGSIPTIRPISAR